MRSGWRCPIESSTSRMWIPATERAEPRRLTASAIAKAITGRRTRSFTRLATNPTTPWCQLSSNRHTPLRCGAPGPGSARQRTAPLLVGPLEPRRERLGGGEVIGEKALDADGHVVDPAGGVQARRHAKGEIGGGEIVRRAAGNAQQRTDAGPAASGANAPQPLRDQYAVIGIERHDVGDRAERHQVQQVRRAGGRGARKP